MTDPPEPGLSPRRMLAAELVRPGLVQLRDVPLPTPGPGELLVRIEAALTCGTDLKTFQRGHPKIPLPTPMGHEFSGVVTTAGAGVQAFRENDAIACVPSAPCGSCRLCRRGQESLCPDAVGRMVFGAFAEYVLLPRHIVEANVFLRPAHLSAEVAAALEPLACVVHGSGRVALDRAETVVLLGDGPIALLFVQLARLAGAGRILLMGKHRVRLDAARALGAEILAYPGTDTRDGEPAPVDSAAGTGPGSGTGTGTGTASGTAIGAGREPLPAGSAENGRTGSRLRDAVLDWTGGTGADVVVECVGRSEVWEEAASLAAPGGEVLLYGGCAAGTRASFDTYRIHYDEVDIKGAFHYGRADVRRAFDLLSDGAIHIEPLITHRHPLAGLEEALAVVLRREAIKVAIRP